MTKTEICNTAVSFLGSGQDITDVDTEKSASAIACRRYYDLAVRTTLRDFPWPFATKVQALALVEEDPNDEWAYSYRMPSDCLCLRRILSGMRTDTKQSVVKYKIATDNEGALIWTDQEDAEAEMTFATTATQSWPDDFIMALARRLAMLIGARVGASSERIQEQVSWYRYELQIARAKAANEEQPDEEPLSEFERSRA